MANGPTRASDQPITEQTAKIRRNLLIVSLIIIFKSFSGASFKKISVLGSEISVPNPTSIDVFLFFFCAP